jgi:hypothetical protein
MELLSFTHVSEWLKPISLDAEGIHDDPRSGQRSTVQNLQTAAKFFLTFWHASFTFKFYHTLYVKCE